EYTLIPILEDRKNFIQFSLGKRVYQLIIQDLEMEAFIEFQNLTNGKIKILMINSLNLRLIS
ncbi:hypothetical protein, partial [Streptococcus anginosus]|uniref:hypothetical protein n=1 Tax=Streptococcus anginosus TaxID=1328 RepID=UPI00055FC015